MIGGVLDFDGVAVLRQGLERRWFRDLYHYLVIAPWPAVIFWIAAGFAAINAAFAAGYLLIGGVANARPGSFSDAFFFSVQTMATIGYGKFAPRTLFAHILVTLETFVGLLGVAMTTGLTFAKFSRPTARVLFSRVAVVRPWNGIPSLMFRMANQRSNQIVEAHLHVVLARDETTAEGESIRRFHDLELTRRQNAIFALSWTAMHAITERSPLYGASSTSLAAAGAEIVVSLVGTDETFSQTVHARYSYVPDEIVWDARFVDIISQLPDGRRRIDYTRFHDVVPLGAPAGSGA